MSIKGLDIFKSNRMSFMKLYNYKSFDDIPYESLDFHEDLIRIVCDRTPSELIKYTDDKVYFCHPIHKNFACDIFGSAYDISQVNQPQLMIYHDTIFISCKHDGVLKYNLLKFKEECLKIYPSDKLNDEYKSALADEVLNRQNKEYELKKQMKMLDDDEDDDKDSEDSDDNQ